MAGGPRRSGHYGAMSGVALGADVTKACFLVGASKGAPTPGGQGLSWGLPGVNLH